MAKNITLFGQDFSNVPAINVPLQGGGTARFIDEDEGGGGSSDFRFVEITISGVMRDFIMPMPLLFDNKVYVMPNPGLGTFQVPIYNNFLEVAIAGDWDTSWFSTTGNVSFVDGAFRITGDGTITIS